MQPDRGESETLVRTGTLVAEPGYYSPDPLVWLLANEVTVVVEGWK